MSGIASEKVQVNANNKSARQRLRGWPALILAVCGLLAGGMGYRIASTNLKRIVEAQIALERPLSSFPLEVMNWRGEDVPVPVNIQKVAGTDDFLSRLYVNKEDKTWVNLYVAYTARPRAMLGHQPRICYPANGWVHVSTDSTEVTTRSGRHIPCLLHRFHKPEQEHEERFVLNYYVVNGQLTDDESVFSGVGWRTPNIGGNPARYAAQVQISSVLESSVRKAAQEITNIILDFLPDKNGKTRAAEFIPATE